MKKWKLFFILLTMLALTACGTPETTLPTEPYEEPVDREAEIRAAWFEKEQHEMGTWYDPDDETTKHSQWRHYGRFDGYEILFCEGMTEAEEHKVIAGQCFPHNCGFTLYAYRDGEFAELEDVFKAGKLGAHAVWDIARCHYEYQVEIYGDEFVEGLYLGCEKPE